MEIHLGGSDQRCLLPPFGPNIENGKENKRKIVGHEGCGVPVILQEHSPAAELQNARHSGQSRLYTDLKNTYDADEQTRDGSVPCSERLQPG